MCSNCFMLDKDLSDDNGNDGKLLKCGACRRIKYCSRECQKKHWKKVHKRHCTK